MHASPSGERVSDYTGAGALLGCLPKAEWLLADWAHDADWFRYALKDKGLKPCIPVRQSPHKSIKQETRRYNRRSRIAIIFARLKDWPIVRKAVTRTVF